MQQLAHHGGLFFRSRALKHKHHQYGFFLHGTGCGHSIAIASLAQPYTSIELGRAQPYTEERPSRTQLYMYGCNQGSVWSSLCAAISRVVGTGIIYTLHACVWGGGGGLFFFRAERRLWYH